MPELFLELYYLVAEAVIEESNESDRSPAEAWKGFLHYRQYYRCRSIDFNTLVAWRETCKSFGMMPKVNADLFEHLKTDAMQHDISCLQATEFTFIAPFVKEVTITPSSYFARDRFFEQANVIPFQQRPISDLMMDLEPEMFEKLSVHDVDRDAIRQDKELVVAPKCL
jgi:hypothetical protein